MKKILKLSAILFFVFGSSAHAQVVMVTPDVHTATIRKVEICTDITCSAPTVLATGDLTFDIMSVGAGNAISDYAANASIPRGISFPYLRLTLSRTFTVQGAASVSGVVGGVAACYTHVTGDPEDYSAGKADGGTIAANLIAANAAKVPQTLKLEQLPEDEFVPGVTMIAEQYTFDDVIEMHRLPTPVFIDVDDPAPVISLSFDGDQSMSFAPNGANCSVDSEPLTISIDVE